MKDTGYSPGVPLQSTGIISAASRYGDAKFASYTLTEYTVTTGAIMARGSGKTALRAAGSVAHEANRPSQLSIWPTVLYMRWTSSDVLA